MMQRPLFLPLISPLAGILAIASLVAIGCGGDEGGGASSGATTTTSTSGSGGGGGQGGSGGADPSCRDSLKNASETDVDCGGAACPPCAVGLGCADGSDCESLVCDAALCAAPTCADAAKNGDETDVDCGGSCAACADGAECNDNVDCQSLVCSAGLCASPTCDDQTLNGSETDLDCGGADCAPCADGLDCLDAADCESLVCDTGMCVAATCVDAVLNGDETDVDCGGSCLPCVPGHVCAVGGDCDSGVCSGNVCQAPSCSDGVANGSETDIDCGGGACAACAAGLVCVAGSDCDSFVCSGAVCQMATCADSVKNGLETDVDCGGGTCGGCANGLVCGVGGDCQSGSCSGNVCQCVDTVGLLPSSTPPTLLSAAGLYSNIANKTINSYAKPYTPQYPLWSDGSVKNRWIYIPMCTQIDTSNMDSWSFPVGTRIWKEFIVNGQLVETRYIHRWGPGASDFIYAPYRWNAQGTDATYTPGGASNVNGTQHDIPAAAQCTNCHRTAAKVLGVEAIQLSHQGAGETMASLSAAGYLSVPAPNGFAVPGNATDQAALGYLHANCGSCHNPGSAGFTFHTNLSVTDNNPMTTKAFLTGVNVVSPFVVAGMTDIIEPGNPALSVASYRMGQRGNVNAMPPLATEVVDNAGKAAVDAWITSLP